MTVTQTVDIPASHRLTIDVPKEVPVGRAQVFIQFPFNEGPSADIPAGDRGQTRNEAFRNAIRRAYGAWKENPWTSHAEDVNAMRDEWDHRDPWNPDPAKTHRD